MALIRRANHAKLLAHPALARAFLATAPRPIVHVLPDRVDEPQIAFRRLMEEVRRDLAAARATCAPEAPASRPCA